MKHRDYMYKAIAMANQAAANGDVPVGALIVQNGEIICQNYNRREAEQSATAHAEILVIEEACRKLKRRRLNDCALYVTMEPCPMCAGAIALAQLKTLVFGCYDSLWGGAGSIFNIVEHPNTNHKTEVLAGICAEECKEQVQQFFRSKRR
ncbi:MAG: tRNA adenosine(34) deaminase TadA [Bacillota bacterium]|jgi:tRNA(adenine34) deaminase